MQVTKTRAIDVYGHRFVLLAEAKPLPFSFKGVQRDTLNPVEHDDEFYKTHRPERLVIRESLGQYFRHIAKGDNNNATGRYDFANLVLQSDNGVHESAADALMAAQRITNAAGGDIPIVHQELPALIDIPGLVDVDDTLFCFPYDVMKTPLTIYSFKITTVGLMTLRDTFMLSVEADNGDGNIFEDFAPNADNTQWISRNKDKDFAGFFFKADAEAAARTYAAQIVKNLGSFARPK